MKHALIIGGSGMLKSVSLWFANKGYTTSVIARSQQNLNTLVQSSALIKPIVTDYSNLETFRLAIRHQIQTHGPFTTVVAWVHNNQKEVLNIVHQEITSVCTHEYELFHVLSSREHAPTMKKVISIEHNVYCQIQLGFKMELGTKRWLTHEEICEGVLKSVEKKKNVLVGMLQH